MWKKALDTLGLARSEREVRKWEEGCYPEGEKGFSAPSSWLLGQGKMQEVEEDHKRLWENAQLMEMCGNGQNKHFMFLSEGV